MSGGRLVNGGFAIVAVVVLMATAPAGRQEAAVPAFEVDPFWPKPLPNNWIVGQVSGLSVDARDHVWIVHRQGSLTTLEAGAAQTPPLAECCIPAPPVIEFDPDGNVVQAWGGPGDGYDWPSSEHGLHVDHRGHVWIAGDGKEDHQVLKFDRSGKFLLQIGKAEQTGGSGHTAYLGRPAAIEVDPEANEVYIADGYGNRRVVVFDAETGEYQRHWGAYGKRPEDDDLGGYDPEAPPAQQFRGPVHGLAISNDGLVYVADRMSNRLQVFRKNGEFVKEAFIAPKTLSMGSVWDIALSRDPAQRFLYVPDGTNGKTWILARENLRVLDSFGRRGRQAGQFGWIHNLGVDSNGNLYISEVETGKRVQKFAPRDAAATE